MSESDINNTTTISTPNAGNGLAASSDIIAGSLIFKTSNPYLILLEKAHLESTCSWCFIKPEVSKNLKACGGCKIVRYCSTVCQKNDWQAIHKKECKVLKVLPDIPPTPTRGLMQLSLRHEYGKNPDPALAGLVTNEPHLAREQRERYAGIQLQALAAAKYTGRKEDWVQMLTRVLCQMATNGIRVTLPDDTPIGICFDPVMALANHSCRANAAVVFNGRTASLRAMTDIKQGEEIFVSYIGVTQPTINRRKELRERYFFTCQCQKCSKDENEYQTFLRCHKVNIPPRRMDMLVNSSLTKAAAEEALVKFADLQNDSVKSRAWDNVQYKLINTEADKAIMMIDPRKMTQYGRDLRAICTFGVNAIPPIPSTVHGMYLNFLDKEEWALALICLLSITLHSDPYNYPEAHHPQRVMRLFTIAKLLHHIVYGKTGEEVAASLLTADIEPSVKRKCWMPFCELEYFGAWQVLLGIVEQEVERGYGKGSRFAQEVEEFFQNGRKSESEMREEPDNLAVKIQRWLNDPSDEAGREEAEKAVKTLKDLADCVVYIMELPPDIQAEPRYDVTA